MSERSIDPEWRRLREGIVGLSIFKYGIRQVVRLAGMRSLVGDVVGLGDQRQAKRWFRRSFERRCCRINLYGEVSPVSA